MPNKPKFMRTAAERAVETLEAHHTTTGEIPVDVFREQASVSGYSVRQLKRLVELRLAGKPLWKEPKFEVTEQVITAVFLACGCLAQAHRLLRRHGIAVPPESTFKRHVKEVLNTAQMAYARGGSKAFRNAQVYLAAHYPHRMHSILLDHTELPIWVVPRGHKQAVKPWITAVMDGKTRYVLSWTITYGRPTAEEVRAALMSAMTLRLAPDGTTIVGGKPLRAVWDRGLEFLANLITESCLRLDVLPVALPAYSPHLKGRLERFWRFLKEDCLAALPGYVEGPTDLRGNSAIAGSALGEDEFLVKLADWIDWYITEHRVKGDATPLEAWRGDGTALNEVAPEQLWLDMLIAKDQCKVSKNGIRFDRIDWTAPGMTGHVGQRVEIRYLPHDRTFIEVFRDGRHLFTAMPQSTLTADQQQEHIQKRAEERRLAQQRFTVANRQRRSNAVGPVHRLTVDKDGNRLVTAPPDDLLDGGGAALAELIGDSSPQQRLF